MSFRQTFGERLGLILTRYESRQAASKIAGVNPDQLAKYVDGRAKPPFELVARLAADKNVSLDWLATGRGMADLSAGVGDGFFMADLYPAYAASGRATTYDLPPVMDRIALPFLITDRIKIPAANVLAVFNRGVENAPDIEDGDLLIVERGAALSDDGFYLIDTGDVLLCRFVERRVGGIVIRMGKKEEARDKKTAEGLKIFGRVRWRIGAI